MTDAPQLSEEQLAELERLLAKCVPQNIDTAEYKDDGLYECPACSGDGEVEGRVYTNYDNQPNGVQFFGIGHAPLDAEALFRKAIAALPALLAMARRSVPERDARRCTAEKLGSADDLSNAVVQLRAALNLCKKDGSHLVGVPLSVPQLKSLLTEIERHITSLTQGPAERRT